MHHRRRSAGITTYIGNANAAVVVDGNLPLKSVVIDSGSVFPSSADISIDQESDGECDL